MSVLSRCFFCEITFLFLAYSDSNLIQDIPMIPFHTRVITRFSYEDSNLRIRAHLNGSDMVCGAMCLTAQNNCTGFKMDRNQCHLLRSWSFASEPGDPKGGVKVHQLNVSAWSKIMLVGGRGVGFAGTSNVEVIDLANGKHCDSPTPLPTTRYGMHSFVLGSKLLTIGGVSGDESDITSYNYDDHLWESIGTLDAPWADYSLGRIQDPWILLMGGHYASVKTEMTMILNANGSMVRGPNLPMAAAGFCACGLDDNHIFITGGQNAGGTILRTTYVLDWKTQEWTTLDPMVLPRYYAECGTFLSSNQELSILVMGGIRQEHTPYPNTEIYSWSQQSWRVGPDFAVPKIFLSRLSSFDGKLFAFGGYNDDDYTFLSSIYTFLPSNESWVRFPLDMNVARRDFGIMMIPDEIADC